MTQPGRTQDDSGGVYDDLKLPSGTWRPYTAIQMVMTVDGAITGPTADYWPISLDADQRTFRRFRIHFDAVLHGARTLGMRVDRYMWSAELQRERRRRGLDSPPLFIVVSNSGRIDPDDRVFGAPQLSDSAGGGGAGDRRCHAWTSGRCRDRDDRHGQRRSERPDALLGGRTQRVRRLVCEGGAILNYHMLTAGLVDEFFITVTPSIIGEPRPRTAVEGATSLPSDQLQRLKLISTVTRDGEVFLRYTVCRSK